MNEEQYQIDVKRLDALKDIENDDPRCDEFNELYDKVVAYEDEHSLPIVRN